MAISHMAAAWMTRDTWPWRSVFVGYAAGCLFWSLAYSFWIYGERDLGDQLVQIGERFQRGWQWLMFSAVASLAITDLYRGRSRDWLHWTGIGYVAAWVLSSSVLDLMHRLATS